MKRFCICPVIGSGGAPEGDPYRAAVFDLPGVASVPLIPTHPIGHPQQGQPKYAFCFALVATTNMPSVEQLSNTFLFPDLSLDARMDSMNPATRTAMNQSVEAFVLQESPELHLDMDFYGDSASYRDVLNGVLQQIEPAANISTMDVAES